MNKVKIIKSKTGYEWYADKIDKEFYVTSDVAEYDSMYKKMIYKVDGRYHWFLTGHVINEENCVLVNNNLKEEIEMKEIYFKEKKSVLITNDDINGHYKRGEVRTVTGPTFYKYLNKKVYDIYGTLIFIEINNCIEIDIDEYNNLKEEIEKCVSSVKELFDEMDKIDYHISISDSLFGELISNIVYNYIDFIEDEYECKDILEWYIFENAFGDNKLQYDNNMKEIGSIDDLMWLIYTRS